MSGRLCKSQRIGESQRRERMKEVLLKLVRWNEEDRKSDAVSRLWDSYREMNMSSSIETHVLFPPTLIFLLYQKMSSRVAIAILTIGSRCLDVN